MFLLKAHLAPLNFSSPLRPSTLSTQTLSSILATFFQVLGQLFAPGGVERRVNMVTADVYNCEYVDGIMEDYLTPSLTDPGCYFSEFPVRTQLPLGSPMSAPEILLRPVSSSSEIELQRLYQSPWFLASHSVRLELVSPP